MAPCGPFTHKNNSAQKKNTIQFQSETITRQHWRYELCVWQQDHDALLLHSLTSCWLSRSRHQITAAPSLRIHKTEDQTNIYFMPSVCLTDIFPSEGNHQTLKSCWTVIDCSWIFTFGRNARWQKGKPRERENEWKTNSLKNRKNNKFPSPELCHKLSTQHKKAAQPSPNVSDTIMCPKQRIYYSMLQQKTQTETVNLWRVQHQGQLLGEQFHFLRICGDQIGSGINCRVRTMWDFVKWITFPAWLLQT